MKNTTPTQKLPYRLFKRIMYISGLAMAVFMIAYPLHTSAQEAPQPEEGRHLAFRVKVNNGVLMTRDPAFLYTYGQNTATLPEIGLLMGNKYIWNFSWFQTRTRDRNDDNEGQDTTLPYFRMHGIKSGLRMLLPLNKHIDMHMFYDLTVMVPNKASQYIPHTKLGWDAGLGIASASTGRFIYYLDLSYTYSSLYHGFIFRPGIALRLN